MRSIDVSEDQGHRGDGRALQMVELASGEVIWSVLDTLRSPGPDDMDDELRSNYFPSRGSYASQYSGPEEAGQLGFREMGRSTSRVGHNAPPTISADDAKPETKVCCLFLLARRLF